MIAPRRQSFNRPDQPIKQKQTVTTFRKDQLLRQSDKPSYSTGAENARRDKDYKGRGKAKRVYHLDNDSDEENRQPDKSNLCYSPSYALIYTKSGARTE